MIVLPFLRLMFYVTVLIKQILSNMVYANDFVCCFKQTITLLIENYKKNAYSSFFSNQSVFEKVAVQFILF